MVFSSIPFLFYYLPLLLLAYYCVPAHYRQTRNGLLTLASLAFYAWGEGIYLLVLIGSIIFNHFFAQILRTPSLNKLLIAIAFNLCLLGYFKYSGFLAEMIGMQNWFTPVLPLGISFFTFQAISYLIDVYRKEAQPCLLYTSPSPRDRQKSRMPSSA